MPETDIHKVARKMRGPGGAGRVVVLDVDYSSTKYGIVLAARASRHSYYLRPPEGMDANDLKHILDEAGGEEELTLRYNVYPELQTDLKPLLSADPFAAKYFGRDEDRKFLQLEGERPKARETIAIILEGLKESFKAEDFPRIDELALNSFKPMSEGRRAELLLLRKDRDKDELRKSEPAFHVAVAEHGFAREIEIHRPMVAESEPILIINSNEHTSDLGYRFLSDLAKYFGTQTYAERSQVADKESAERAAGERSAPAPNLIHQIPHAPSVQPTKLDEGQLVTKVVAAIKDLLPGMKLLQKREVSRSGHWVTIQFPGVLGFGKGPSANEIKELQSVFRAVRGDPSFGSDWRAYYQVDGKTGEMRIAPSLDAAPSHGWTAL